jgi:hypothetical protein
MFNMEAHFSEDEAGFVINFPRDFFIAVRAELSAQK